MPLCWLSIFHLQQQGIWNLPPKGIMVLFPKEESQPRKEYFEGESITREIPANFPKSMKLIWADTSMLRAEQINALM